MSHYTPRPGAAIVTLACAAIALAGCGGSTKAPAKTGPPTGKSAGGGAAITIKNFAFVPATLTVGAGTTVRVTNADSAPHTVTASGGASPGASFDTGHIGPGKTAAFTAPTAPGSYAYDCSIHPFMRGTLLVTGPQGATAGATG